MHQTGRREAVLSIVECKSSQKNMPDSTVTLPRSRNAEKIENELGRPWGAVWPISGCDLGQKNAANLMEGVK